MYIVFLDAVSVCFLQQVPYIYHNRFPKYHPMGVQVIFISLSVRTEICARQLFINSEDFLIVPPTLPFQLPCLGLLVPYFQIGLHNFQELFCTPQACIISRKLFCTPNSFIHHISSRGNVFSQEWGLGFLGVMFFSGLNLFFSWLGSTPAIVNS